MARSVETTFTANVSGYLAGVSKMQASTVSLAQSAGKSMQANAAGWDKISNAAAVGSVAIAAGIGLAVKRFADFDQAMSAVAANSGAVGAELASLRSIAVEFGATTQFSATEAAQGINELAKAGVATADIMGGGLKGALDLAAAGQIGVADAAEATASALNQFGLEGGKAGHVADLLSNAANAAQGSVGDMSAALGQAGVAANAAGLNIDETTTLLALFAKAGMTGSDAGTSLKTMMQRLAAPTAEAAAELDRLGISAYDSQGQFIGAEKVLGLLSTQTENMSTQARAAAFSTIFGSDAIRAASIAAEAGASGYAAMNEEVTRFGGAAEQAAALTDNLKGDMERLGGAFDSVLISSGSGANGALRSLTQGLTGLVEVIGRVPGPVLLAGAGLAAMALAVPKGIRSYQEMTSTLSSVGLSMDNIAAKSPRAGAALSGVGKAAGVAGKAFAALAVASVAASVLTDDSTTVGVQQLTNDLLDAADAVGAFDGVVKNNAAEMGNFQSNLSSTGDVLRATFDPGFMDTFTRKGDTFLRTITLGMLDMTTTTDDAAARLGELDAVLSGLVAGGSADEATRVFDQFAAAAQAQGISVDELKTKLPGYSEALAAAARESAGLSTEVDAVAAAAEASAEAITGAVDAIKEFGSAASASRSAESEFQAAIDDASASIKENGETLDLRTEKGRANDDALRTLAATTIAATAETFNLSGSMDAATAKMDEGRKAFIKAAEAAGLSADGAAALADQLGLIPEQTTAVIEQTGAVEATAEVAGLRDTIFRLDGKVVTVKEEGADPSKGRVIKLDGSIFGLKGKTVEVKEIGANAAGERVVSFKGKIFVLKGKTVAVTETGANASAARVEGLRSRIAGLQSKTVRVNVMTAYSTTGSVYRSQVPNADGGLHVKAGGSLVKAYADGGFHFDTSLRDMQPQIIPSHAARGGLLVAEEGAGPWEGFVSGHPAKRPRSRAITQDIAGRLGGEVTWHTALADGAVLSRGAAYRGDSAGRAGVVVNIDGALDPVAVGAQVERVLQDYTSVTGRPLQVVTR